MQDKLLNPEGLPWTVGVSLAMTILLFFVTGGIFAVLLGTYLAYWLLQRHQRCRSIFFYGLLIGGCSLHFLPAHVLPENIWTAIDLIIFAVWVAAEFVLRHEIMAAYREHEGYELTISPIWTFIGGSIYLNYCIPPYTPRDLV